jgi:hypothetical protein
MDCRFRMREAGVGAVMGWEDMGMVEVEVGLGRGWIDEDKHMGVEGKSEVCDEAGEQVP